MRGTNIPFITVASGGSKSQRGRVEIDVMFSLIADLAVATGALLLMLMAGAVEWRRTPYGPQEFSAAMERICDGVEELWRAQDEAMFPGSKPFADEEDLRRLCNGMLRDMLNNTCYILERAEPCSPDVLGHGPAAKRRLATAEINRRAAEVVRQGTRLIFRLRRAQIRLAFLGDSESVCALAAEVAEQYACLWSEVVGLIEVRVSSPACAERLNTTTASCRNG